MTRNLLIVLVAAAAFLATLGLRAEGTSTASQKASLLDVSREGYQITKDALEAGTGKVDDVVQWSLRMFEAGHLDAVHPDSKLLKRHLDRLVTLEAKVRSQHKAGGLARVDLLNAKFHRVQAELWVKGVGKP